MRLSAFEEFMLTDDRPGYRQTFLIETTFEGEIDRAAFDAGVAEACRRHPLLSSLVRPNRIWGWRWVHQPGLAPRIDWGCREQPFTFSEGEGVDLAREAGVRFHARVGANESRLIAQFHHACCDGYGAIQFLADLFTAYTRHLKPRDANPPAYQAIKPQTLLCRDNLRVHTQREMIWFRLFVRTLANYARHVLHAPATLAGPAASRRVGASLTFPGTLTRTLAPEVLRGLKKAARRFDVTVNELLARELLLTLRDWNARQGAARDTDRFSIIVPTNLRNLEHDFMPAANVIGLVAFQRAARQLNDPDELLASIREESRFYKRWRFAAAFLDSIRVVRVFPGLLRLILRRKQSAGTAIFSCLGDPSRVITARFPINAQGHPILGNLLLTDVNAAPPIRPHTHAAFTAWHFLDKLRLGVRCNPQVFTQESAKELLDLFTERVVNQTSPAAEAAVIQRVAA
jgi:hypothetical protein